MKRALHALVILSCLFGAAAANLAIAGAFDSAQAEPRDP